MSGRTSGERDWQRLHALVERYTPDGWLGRLMLGAVAGSVSGTLLLLALFWFGMFSFLSVLGGFLALAGGLATALVTVLTLWPVYLSLIGNVESAADYDLAAAGRTRSSFERPDSFDSSTSGNETADEGSVALLKQRYAAGELSDDEFERRLDRLLAADQRVENDAESDRSGREPVTESET